MSDPAVTVLNQDVLDHLRRTATNAFGFTLCSPPYYGKLKRYGGKGRKMTFAEYCAWQSECIVESVRTTDGVVAWVANNPVQGGRYKPANETILSILSTDKDIVIKRPVIWHKNSGSAPGNWLRNDYEHVMLFTKPTARQICNWPAVASVPVYDTGGRYHQRTQTGERRKGSAYPKLALANPGDVLRATVGGGHMGYDADDDKLACAGFAPFPLKLAEWLVKVFANPGDHVHDPMSGTGTTGVAAVLNECHFTGNDLDPDAVKVSMERIERAISSPPIPTED